MRLKGKVAAFVQDTTENYVRVVTNIKDKIKLTYQRYFSLSRAYLNYI